MRTVILGASSGLGRCLATGLGARGAQLALLARRHDQLVDAATEAGPGALAITCDVTDEDSCRAAIEEAGDKLGGIDALIYATGVGPLDRIENIDADTWRRTFDTNVVGASTATAAALPYLRAADGIAVYLSSVSASRTAPWPGLGAYAVSKAALDKLIEVWRGEHPEVGFTQVVVGNCGGSEGAGRPQFTADWDSAVAMEVYPLWEQRNFLTTELLDVEDLIHVVHMVLQAGSTTSIPTVAVTHRTQL